MNKKQLVEAVSTQSGLSKVQANLAIQAMITSIIASLKKDDRVNLVGFGSFKLKKRASRIGNNPKTGEKITIPERGLLSFSAGKFLKESIN